MAVGPQDTVIVAGCGGVFAVTGDGQTELLTELPAGATDVAIAGSGGAALYVTTGDGALLRGDVAATL
jgi:hypothetical protein